MAQNMAQKKQASTRKRKRKAIPVLGAAGLSLSLAGGSAAAMTPPASEAPSQSAGICQNVTLAEEEISDVSLATFYVFDKENVLTRGPRVRWAMAGGCGCMGCGGCGGCWTGTYYEGSVFGNDAYPPPPYHPRKPAKYAKTPKGTQSPKNQ